MSKNPLRTEQEVFDAGLIDTDPERNVLKAANWANAVWNKIYLGMGDSQEAAMYRAAAKHGVDPGTFWALRYRKPKAIAAHILARLYVAYETEIGKQEARLRHELELTRRLPQNAARQALIAEAEAALADETVEGGSPPVARRPFIAEDGLED